MTRFGVLRAGSLLGRELVERLAGAFPGSEIHLFTRDPERVGTLAEAGSVAVLHELADAESLAQVDVLAIAETGDEDVEALLTDLAPEARLLLVEPWRFLASPAPHVAGVNERRDLDARALHSPHAVTVALALLLEPLLDLAPMELAVTAILPVSQRDKAGIDELVEQTRALLTFQSPLPEEELGVQLAYNLVPVPDPSACSGAAAQLRSVLDLDLPLDLTLARAGVFHGIALSVTCRFASRVDLDSVRQRLADAPFVSLASPDAAPGAIEAAAHEGLLVAVLGSGHRPDRVRFWIVIDHLVRGGAANAVALLAAALAEDGPVS
jgi:aspartate-semialdehyde dehydrogenase